MNSTEYVQAVRARLERVPGASEALADLADLAAETVAAGGGLVEQLGSPERYADRLRAELATGTHDEDSCLPREAQANLGGLPVELRGPVDARVRARIWDPANPALFVPRLFGAGWALNLGAMAVRLGLIRPDDYDEEVLAAIPPAVIRVARVVPAALTATMAATVATTWAGLPDQVPVSWDLLGRPTRLGSKRGVAGLVAASAAVTTWSAVSPVSASSGSSASSEPREDALVRAALATMFSAVAAGSTAATMLDARTPIGRRGHGNVAALSVLVAVVLGVLDIALPVRAGLRTTWRAKLGAEKR